MYKARVYLILFCFLSIALHAENLPKLEQGFITPPTSAKPYVWWHWMGSNFSKRGITEDLEAMREEGIGGATIFNICSAVQESHKPTENNPWPTQTYRSPEYWDAMKWAAIEAERLGLELGLHNTAGYSTTGGPWINEERAMKQIVMHKVDIVGGENSVLIPQPELKPYSGWGSTNRSPSRYEDIAILAYPANEEGKVNMDHVKDLTTQLDNKGILNYKLPAGKWVVYRIGYTSTMANPHPLPDELIGKSLEADKMTVQNTKFHWNNVLQSFVKNLKDHVGRGFKHMLIDSYEAGLQNWSENFQKEFIQRKGYDPIPWLITAQQIINDEEQTKRFKWDYQDVIADLYYSNGWKVAAEMLHRQGMTLHQEPYYGPFNMIDATALADIPMGEFWTGSNGAISAEIPAAARAAGRTIVGAEAFTGTPAMSAWTEDPAFLKPSTEGAFSSGVNRLILHHWVHQPFDNRFQPGMGMGWWGTHFNRNQTWFEPAKAYFEYLSRTQYMLQQGEQVSDYLCLEKQVGGFSDIISTRQFLQDKIYVKDQQIILPSGRKYAFMVFPDSRTMLPEVLDKLTQLVKKGAIIVAAEQPVSSPSLKEYPIGDRQLANIANQIWANYKNQIFTTVDEAKKYKNIAPDFMIDRTELEKEVSFVHRRTPAADIYYIANQSKESQKFTVSLRVANKLPELWNAEEGSIIIAPTWNMQNERTEVELNLRPMESTIIVLQKEPDAKQIAEGLRIKPLLKLQKEETINHDWIVKFAPKLGQPFERKFDILADWSMQTDKALAYFAGTATYYKTINIKKEMLKDKRLELDLGEMHDIAELKINGEKVGTLWYPPYVKDITKWLHEGENEVEIAVTNNWANALIGDEQITADFEWGEDRGTNGRALKKYPEWFLKDQQRPSERKSFTTWYYYHADSPLQKAGLVGPVKLKEYMIYQHN